MSGLREVVDRMVLGTGGQANRAIAQPAWSLQWSPDHMIGETQSQAPASPSWVMSVT
jgi:hypothetical protein